jgi:hypothetical protein
MGVPESTKKKQIVSEDAGNGYDAERPACISVVNARC